VIRIPRKPTNAEPTSAGANRRRSVGRRWWSVPLALVAVVSPVVLAGCSSSSSSPTTTSHPSTTPSTVSTPTTGGTTATTASGGGTPAIYEVRTGQVNGLGTVLVDGQGLTLYLFVPDKQSGASTCYNACAQGWPPLLLPTGVTTPVAGSGVKTSLLGTTQRTDGTTQVTYNKWPLYLWVGDSEPGQATGQGLNNLGGLWYVLAPDGSTIKAKP
jgi:predicted lipoprotein with Yx(FWY)xxD motif